MEKTTYSKEETLAQLQDVEVCAKECREAGIDDSYYENHASFLRRELLQLSHNSRKD